VLRFICVRFRFLGLFLCYSLFVYVCFLWSPCVAHGSLEIQDAKIRHLRTIAQLCRAISLQLRHILTIGRNVLNSNISPTCPYNMVNFGPLAAVISSLVWGTPANFNGFHVLAALLHGTVVVGVRQTLQC